MFSMIYLLYNSVKKFVESFFHCHKKKIVGIKEKIHKSQSDRREKSMRDENVFLVTFSSLTLRAKVKS